MSQNTICSLGEVPFSWENSPGVCKVNCNKYSGEEKVMIKLPPPPSESPRVVLHDLQIPLPPCPFQPPLRSPSKRGSRREDPFLAAYRECTKKGSKGNLAKGGGLRISLLSCKSSCEVKEGHLVKLVPVLPRLPSLARSEEMIPPQTR